MTSSEATPLQALILRRLSELGSVGRPMAVRTAADQSGGRIHFEDLRALARGERGDILTTRECEGLAAALSVPVGDVAAAATVLPDLE